MLKVTISSLMFVHIEIFQKHNNDDLKIVQNKNQPDVEDALITIQKFMRGILKLALITIL